MLPCQEDNHSFFGNCKILKTWIYDHLRGLSLQKIKCVQKKELQQTMADLRTLTTPILQKTNCRNKKEQLEDFADNLDNLILTLKTFNFF
jgi:nitrate/nitrite-specific signal transduction histidine kinase